MSGCALHQTSESAKPYQRAFVPPPETKPLLEDLRGDHQSPELSDSLSLDACIELALENNHKRPASRFAVAIAEAQHRQAMAGYWPHLHLKGTANLRSDDLNFLYPETEFGIPAQNIHVPESSFAFPGTTINTPPTAITIPAGAFGNPVDLQLPVGSQQINVPASDIRIPAQTFSLPAQSFHVPEQDIKVADRFMYGTLADLKWLLLDGGMRRSLRDQAHKAIEAAKEDARRSDLEIIFDVKRYYHGAVLAREVESIGRETLQRMDATLELTEKLYQGGSLQVKKTDYLRNKVLVENIRMLVEKLAKNRELAESALVHAMGLSWKSQVTPGTRLVEYKPVQSKLSSLIEHAYVYSPEWRKVGIGIDAARAQIREEKSGYAPKVAIIGSAHTFQNAHGHGISTDQNLNAWNIGVGVELPLFRGFFTKNRVAEAKARLGEIRAQKVVLREGLAMQIKSVYLDIKAKQRQEAISAVAEETATENRDLSERGYQNDLIEADDVFQSQLFESLVKARHLKLKYEHTVARARLDLIVGTDIFGDRHPGRSEITFVK